MQTSMPIPRVLLGATFVLAILVVVALMPRSANAESSRTTSSREAAFNVFISDANKTEYVNETTYVAFFSISIANQGDALGDVVMSMIGFPSSEWDWQPNPGGEDKKIESVWPSDVKWVSIVIYAPLNEKAGTYKLTLDVKPGGQLSEINLICIIPQKGGIELVAPASVEKEPGIEVDLPFQIHNTGNGDDTFRITSKTISADWEYMIVGGDITGKVHAGMTTTKIVRVTVPYNAEATAPGKPGVRLSLQINSTFDKSKSDARSCYIKVLQQWTLRFNTDPVNVTTLPGGRVEFNLTVRNDGNGQDNITLAISGIPSGWVTSLTQSWFNISMGTPRRATLDIIPSQHALKGDYWITVKANSTGPPDYPLQESRQLQITIAEVFGVSTTIAKNVSDPMGPGGVAEFPFNVINNGNTNDYAKLTVSAAPDGWFASVDSEGVALGPGQKKEVTFTVSASPMLEQSPAQKYRFSVTVVSTGRPDVIHYVNVSCEITPVGRIDLAVDGDDTITVNPYQKENYNFIFDAMNKGNAEDEIHLAVSGTSWDTSTVHIQAVFYPNLLNVPRYHTSQARMEVIVPSGTPLGFFDVTVEAASTLNPQSRKTVVVHINVIQQDMTINPLKFRKISESKFIAVKQYSVVDGDTIDIMIQLHNNGSAIQRDVNVRVYQDSRVIWENNFTSIGLLKTETTTFRWTASFIGTFKMKAIVTIAGDSDPVDNAAEANVKVKEKAGGGGGIVENPWSLAPGKPLFFLLVIVVVIGILATVRYMLNLRGEQHTRDLYESIYGEDMVQEKDGPAPDEYNKYDKGNP